MPNPSVFPDLYTVIVNYNLKGDTIDCIDSFLQAKAQLSHIIVVDNASTDGTVEALRERYGSELHIIVAPENRGYPHALNIGIPKALELGAEWVLLMNNDTLVAPDFLAELEKATLRFPQYALFGPMILYHEEPNTIWYLGYKTIPGTMIGVRSYRGHKDNNRFPPVVPIDLMHGCSMMVRRDVFETIGLFDDSELIYGDDADFSWRARLFGYKFAGVTGAKMWHKITRTMGRQKPRTRYLRIRNTVRFYRRYARGLQLLIMFLFTTVRSFIIGINDLIHGRTELIRPLIFGWFDGWTNRSLRRY